MHIASGDLWAGAEVQLFTLVKFQSVRDNTQLHVVLLNEGELSGRLRELSITVTVLDESHLSGWVIFLKLRRLMLSWRPVVIHTHRQKENVLGGLANVMTVAGLGVRTVHGAPEFDVRFLQKPAKWLFVKLDYWVGRLFQEIVVSVSDELSGELVRLFGRKKVHVVLNGVDVDALSAVSGDGFRKEYGQAINHVGIVGRLEPVKRVDIFLQLAGLALAEGIEEWRFHVFGDGSLMSVLKGQAQDLGVSERVIFHGHRSDVGQCIKAMDTLIMCSDHEGLPMTALEAVALGTRVIAHNVGGLPKLLADGGGYVVDSQAAGDYFAALKSAEAGKGGVLAKEYSAYHNAESMIKLYKQALEEK